MMTQLYDILAALCLPALLAVALLLHALGRGRRRAAEAEARLRQQLDRLRSARAELERTSCTDPLTGVWNYRYLQTALDREVARCARHLHRSGGGTGAATGGRRRGRASRCCCWRSTASTPSAASTAAGAAARCCGTWPSAWRWSSGRRTSSAATAARSSWCCCPTRTGTAPSTRPSACAGRSADTRCRCPTAAAGNGLTAHVGIASLPPDGAHAALLLRAADRSLAEAKEQRAEEQGGRQEAGNGRAVHRQ